MKQVFILSRDALMERKARSALTILMVLVGGALMVTINGMSEGSAAFANKQLVSLAPNVIFVSPGSKSKSHYFDTDQIFAWKRIEKAYGGKAA